MKTATNAPAFPFRLDTAGMTPLRSATNTEKKSAFTQRNDAFDISDTPKGKHWLAQSQAGADLAPWRAALEGMILAERIVQVETFTGYNGDPSTDTHPMVSTHHEVDTVHGTLVLGSYDSVEAFVSNSRNAGVLGGTWRKRGGIVGHSCFWIESFAWVAGRRGAVKRNSANLNKRVGSLDALIAARTGMIASKDLKGCNDTHNADGTWTTHPVREAWSMAFAETDMLCRPVWEARKVQRARETLAAAGEAA